MLILILGAILLLLLAFIGFKIIYWSVKVVEEFILLVRSIVIWLWVSRTPKRPVSPPQLGRTWMN